MCITKPKHEIVKESLKQTFNELNSMYLFYSDNFKLSAQTVTVIKEYNVQNNQ